MTRYEHLNIYKESYNLNILLFGIVSKFSRDYKYSLGDRILDSSLAIISNIILINSSQIQDRDEYFLFLNEAVLKLDLFINLANDLKLLKNEKTYISLIEALVKIKKMKSCWQK